MPMDILSADSDTMLRVLPVAYKYMNEAISDTGMVMMIIMVARHRPRKRNTTIITKRRA